MGVNEFMMPASELSILVWAIQKRYAGKNEPKNPESMTGLISFLGTDFKAAGSKGSMANPVQSILIEAT
jgi:hypothetical protein